MNFSRAVKHLGAVIPALFSQSGAPVNSFENLERSFSGLRTLGRFRVDHRKAMSVSAYYACIRNIAEDVGKLPLILYERQPDKGKEKATDVQPLFNLIRRRPNPDMTAQTWKETSTGDMLSWGNAYSEKQFNPMGDVVALWPIHPSRVQTKRDPSTKRLFHIVHLDTGQAIRIEAKNMLHQKGFGDGIVGMAVISAAGDSVGVAAAQQDYAGAFFGNGSTVSGVLEHPGRLSPEASQRMRENWNEVHQGALKAHKISVLEEGTKFRPMSIPMRHTQFIEGRQFSVEEIARWFRMPPHKIGHLLRSTNNNIEHQGIEYVTDTLDPWLTRSEEQIGMQLIPDERQGELFFEFMIDKLLRGDSEARANFYTKQWMIGALNQNEIRSKENMNGIGPAGDVYYVPASMVPQGTERAATRGGQQIAAKDDVIDMVPAASAALAIEGVDVDGLLRGPLETVAKMLVRKEIKAIKYNAKAESMEFAERIIYFYQGHREHMFNNFMPTTESLYEAHGIAKRQPLAFVTEFCRSMCDEAVVTARNAHKEEIIDSLCETWEANRPRAIVDQILASVKG